MFFAAGATKYKDRVLVAGALAAGLVALSMLVAGTPEAAAGQEARKGDRSATSFERDRDYTRFVHLGRRKIDAALATARVPRSAGQARAAGPALVAVQFDGPIEEEWLQFLADTGVERIAYVPENAYLVHGRPAELEALGGLSGPGSPVRGIVPLEAADKIDPAIPDAGEVEVGVTTVAGRIGSPARILLRDRGEIVARVGQVGEVRVDIFRIDAGEVPQLAELSGVVAIDRHVEPRKMDERATLLMTNLVEPAPRQPLAPGYVDLLASLDLPAGPPDFVIDVGDTGIDSGVDDPMHPDLRVDYHLNFTASTDGPAGAAARDCDGHGTHVAGIVGGDPDTDLQPEGRADEDGYLHGLGVFPGARLGSSKVDDCAAHYGQSVSQIKDAYEAGARISNNSWGAETSAYLPAMAGLVDARTRDANPDIPGNQEYLFVFSAGNSGPDSGTIATPASAKNVIAVGASESHRTSGACAGGIHADDGNDVYAGSAHGPTYDGRLKPDVVAPGTSIVSARVQAPPPTAIPCGGSLYLQMTGTSMAAPAVAGLAGLIRHWYPSGPGDGEPPAPAMTKALIVNGALDIGTGVHSGGPVPAEGQGWGLANIEASVSSADRFFHDQHHLFTGSGETWSETLPVADTGSQVRVSLAWTDVPGLNLLAPWVNDLDLVVIADGVEYRGNNFVDGVSVPGGAHDTMNNLENVYLPTGTEGDITVEVRATNIAGDGVPGNDHVLDQDFALVVSNVAVADTPPPVDTACVQARAGLDKAKATQRKAAKQRSKSKRNLGKARRVHAANRKAGRPTGSSQRKVKKARAKFKKSNRKLTTAKRNVASARNRVARDCP